jgi:hypothetical protein
MLVWTALTTSSLLLVAFPVLSFRFPGYGIDPEATRSKLASAPIARKMLNCVP